MSSFEAQQQTTRPLDVTEVPSYLKMLSEQGVPKDVVDRLLRKGFAEWKQDGGLVVRWRLRKVP